MYLIPGSILPPRRLLQHVDHERTQTFDRVANGPLDLVHDGAVDEQAVGQGRRHIGHDLPFERKVVFGRRFVRQRRADGRGIVAGRLLLVGAAYLHAWGRLPREAQTDVVDVRVVRDGPVHVRLVQPHVWIVEILVVELVRRVFRGDGVPGGEIEPHPVPLERSPKSGIDVEQSSDRVGCAQTRVLVALREIVALQRAARTVHEQRAVERVPAFARNDVHLDPGGVGVGAGAGIVHRHFL